MPSAQLLIETGATLLALGVAATWARRVGISPIPVYLLGGLAFGRGGILPLDASAEFISTGASVGIVLLLFTLGVEYTGSELMAGLRRHAPDGALDLALNALPGVVTALLMGLGADGALVLGGITAVSSSGVVAHVLADLGWLANGETAVVLSLLVIEDVAMAGYLPVVTTVLSHSGWDTGLVRLAIAFAAVAVVLVVATRFGPAVSLVLGGSRTRDDALVLRTFGAVLLVAGAAEAVHVSAAVGAFLVGVAVSGPLASRAAGLVAPLRDVFAGVFFVFFGLQLDPAVIPGVALAASGLALASAGTKLVAGGLAARRAGVGRRGQIRAGVVLMPRGEFSIVIAGLAMSSGMPARLGALAAVYVLILACAAPLLARMLAAVGTPAAAEPG